MFAAWDLLTSGPELFAALLPGPTKAILIVWLAALGGAIGSFLNVVVYRLPAGLSLSRPGSHCPQCKHPIRWHDNVPVLGWLRLRGRCRDCGARISPRYPIVEAITAGVFVLVGVAEGLSFGANLPFRPVPIVGGILLLPPTVDQLCGIVAYHLLLLSTLLAAAGIEYDGHRVPVRLVLPALVVGIAGPLVWPHLHPVSAWPGLTGPVAGVVDGAAGLAAGLAVGLAARPVVGPRCHRGFCLALSCVGLFLGWQAVPVLAALSVAVHVLLRLVGRIWPAVQIELPTTWLAVATLVWILAWAPIVARWPGLA